MEAAIVESFSDNVRYKIFGITKDILAIDCKHTREWDRKNLNRVAAFSK